MFLSCTVIGLIPNGVSTISKSVESRELLHLSSIRRIQPLLKRDDTSSCIVTLLTEEGMPRGRLVLKETYDEIRAKLKPVTL